MQKIPVTRLPWLEIHSLTGFIISWALSGRIMKNKSGISIIKRAIRIKRRIDVASLVKPAFATPTLRPAARTKMAVLKFIKKAIIPMEKYLMNWCSWPVFGSTCRRFKMLVFYHVPCLPCFEIQEETARHPGKYLWLPW